VLSDRKILAVIPARGGSKGVPLKNIRQFKGRPLIEWTIEFVNKFSWIDKSVVSTDHAEIAAISERAGLSCPFVRPDYLAGDRVSDYDVLAHALSAMERIDKCRYEVVLMLQPTSPFRATADIRKVLKKLVDVNLDSVVTVSETPLSFHPLKQFVIKEDRLQYFDEKGRSIISRQDLSPSYFRNGVAYAVTRDCLINQQTVIGKKTAAHVITHHFINIDSEVDFEQGESMPLLA
jgi:CMP-N,N'-diacetyllegionaminic acid synthase